MNVDDVEDIPEFKARGKLLIDLQKSTSSLQELSSLTVEEYNDLLKLCEILKLKNTRYGMSVQV